MRASATSGSSSNSSQLPPQSGGIPGGGTVAPEAGGQRVWCNARIAATAFYERAGMVRIGLPFEIEGIGTHMRMVVAL